MKKILLIDTNTSPFNEAFPVYPIGLDYLEGAIKKEGAYETHILDLTRMGGGLPSPDFGIRKKRSLELIKETVTQESWDVIGLSLRNIDSTYPMTDGDPNLHYYIPDLLAYIDCVTRFSDEKTFIVFGGTAFSMMPDVFMEGRRENCYGIIGAAESTFPHLIQSLLAGNAVSRITRPAIHTIGTLQNRELIRKYFDLPVGESTFGIRTKIGCGQFCGYCPYPLISGPGQYLKETVQVLEEIRLLKDIHQDVGSSQPLRVMFADDIFNRPLTQAKGILRAMIDTGEIPDSWHAYLDPKNIDEDFIRLILETNGYCRPEIRPSNKIPSKRSFHFLFDLESGSSRMLKKIGKPYDVNDIVCSVDTFKRTARRYGGRQDITSIEFGFHILLGYPGEDEESVRETCGLINLLGPSRIAFQIGVRIYPKTPLAGETQGILWREEEDLIKPLFADMNRTVILEWLKKYLDDRYRVIGQKGNMVLIGE